MTLQEQLDAHKAQSQAKAPRDALEIMHRVTEDLRKSGILTGTLKVGDKAPEFTLPNAAGQLVSSKSLLARGPLVVSFYRGKW
jgi:hypothetical protein